jgi:hypothetical protein
MFMNTCLDTHYQYNKITYCEKKIVVLDETPTARIQKHTQLAIAKQWLHNTRVTMEELLENRHNTTEATETVFTVRSVLRIYSGN